MSNAFSPPGVIDADDSMGSYSYKSTFLAQQVATILRAPDKEFELRYIDVQHQQTVDSLR